MMKYLSVVRSCEIVENQYLSYDWSVKEKFYEVTSEILHFNFVVNSTKGFAFQSGLTLDGT